MAQVGGSLFYPSTRMFWSQASAYMFPLPPTAFNQEDWEASPVHLGYLHQGVAGTRQAFLNWKGGPDTVESLDFRGARFWK